MSSPLATRCHLLELPPELRNAIYVYAVVEDDPIPLRKWRDKCCIEPALLASNRQVRTECLPIFYGQNTFETNYSDRIGGFLAALSAEQMTMIRRLRAWNEKAVTSKVRDLVNDDRKREHIIRRFEMDANRWVNGVCKGYLREDAILAPLRVSGGTLWIPVTQLRGWKIMGREGEAIFVRKAELTAKKALP